MTIGIIGYGDFGEFLCRMAKRYVPDARVMVSSSRFAPDGATFAPFEDVCKADVLIPCVPISKFEETIARAKLHVAAATVIVDVCSVKVMPVAVLRGAGVRFVASHPMFGPYSFAKTEGHLDGLRLVVSDGNLSAEDFRKALSFLRALKLNVIEMSAENHDKSMAETLFLTHLVAQTATKGNFVRTDIDTISFGFLMDAVESVRENTELFKDVYRYNPYCKAVFERFKNALEEVESSLTE